MLDLQRKYGVSQSQNNNTSEHGMLNVGTGPAMSST